MDNPPEIDIYAYDYIAKIALVGSTSTGKTSIFNKICHNMVCSSTASSTMGVDFGTINIGNIKLQLWDTAGQEKFKTITRTYYKNVAFILLVFSLNEIKTFVVEGVSEGELDLVKKRYGYDLDYELDDPYKQIVRYGFCHLYSSEFTAENEREQISKITSSNSSKHCGYFY